MRESSALAASLAVGDMCVAPPHGNTMLDLSTT